MEEWDLQALMSNDSHGDFSTTWEDLFPFRSEGALLTRPADLHSGVVLDEILDVYKPFNSEMQSFAEEAMRVKEEAPPPPPPLSLVQSVRSRKRKNRQKKMVEQVTTPDAVSSDTWAWRKYGQKPIKGSPYPRSYYKCSTSKGCLARKQVERSRADPRMFVVTYSGEHNHARPTRRSTLAGVARQKPQPLLPPPEMKGEECSSPGSTPGAGLSPASPRTDTSAMERFMRLYESGQTGVAKGGEVEENQLFMWDDLTIDYNAVDLVGWDVGFEDFEFDEFR